MRRHWWLTVRVVVLLALIGVITGPVLGFLIFLNFSPIMVNTIGSRPAESS